MRKPFIPGPASCAMSLGSRRAIAKVLANNKKGARAEFSIRGTRPPLLARACRRLISTRKCSAGSREAMAGARESPHCTSVLRSDPSPAPALGRASRGEGRAMRRGAMRRGATRLVEHAAELHADGAGPCARVAHARLHHHGQHLGACVSTEILPWGRFIRRTLGGDCALSNINI